jgi:rare lipoprotein A
MHRHLIRPLLLAVCIAALLTAACGKKRTSAGNTRKTPSRTEVGAKAGAQPRASKPKPVAKPGTTEIGMASWYGEPYHGRRAANGEVYDMDKMTAAHRTLPFDTLVEVLNLDNRQEVKVRITDRGPFIDGRIIDLSRAAAKEISMIGPGTAKVRVTVVGIEARAATPAKEPAASKPPPPPAASPVAGEQQPAGSAAGYAVQIGAFSEEEAAEKLQRQMASRYGGAYIENVRSSHGMLYRVRVGPRRTLTEAATLAASLQQEKFQTIVVRVDARAKDC